MKIQLGDECAISANTTGLSLDLKDLIDQFTNTVSTTQDEIRKTSNDFIDVRSFH